MDTQLIIILKKQDIFEEFIKTFDTARKDNFSRYKELFNEALPSLDFEKQKRWLLNTKLAI